MKKIKAITPKQSSKIIITQYIEKASLKELSYVLNQITKRLYFEEG